MICVIGFWILAFTVAEGRFTMSRGAIDDPMPEFMEEPCTHVLLADMCIKVSFPNQLEDVLVLTRMGETSSIYEGFLHEDNDVRVVMIDTPTTKSRLINFNSVNVPSCSNFDIDLISSEVKCVRGGFNSVDGGEMNVTERQTADQYTAGPIVPLGSHFDTDGIPVKVLFTFDTNFYNEFNGKDGKSGDDYMDQVMALVKNAFKDKTLKNNIGTTVNIIGTKKKHNGNLPSDSFYGGKLSGLAREGGNYDTFAFTTAPGANGVAKLGTVCGSDNGAKIAWVAGYGANECGNYHPPKPIDCSKTYNRIVLTSETLAHEIGHSLGMEHDFNQAVYDRCAKCKCCSTLAQIYQYRKYENEPGDCQGLMDYIDDGVGWSKCSARDFSRSITAAGTAEPCLKKESGGNGGSSCIDKNERGYCQTSNKWACTDSRYPWFKEDCAKLCNVCSGGSSPTCVDKNENGYCTSNNKWACTHPSYSFWFKKDCAKLCNAC